MGCHKINDKKYLMKIKIIGLALIVLSNLSTGFSQTELNTPTQTLRGKILDADSKSSIPFANIVLDNSIPLIGVTSDVEGNFKIENVPVGRVTIKVSSLGYELVTVPNILLISGKETVLNIEMKESFIRLDEVEVVANKRAESSNEMALLSTKQLSIEESKRHAGAISDPARLVSSFAGVVNEGSGNNDIIVRGNNPRFIQWRLEDIEIPNPNHFSIEGLTGGPINALNSQMLANSAFYAGAFAPQYGNSLSGIFDMKLRKGNDEQQEYSFSLGALGIDFTAEGPISKKKGSSYLVNYRYSTLGLLDDLGVVDFGGVPKYQDVSYKVFVPTKKAGIFTLFGLAGSSARTFSTEEDENEDEILEEGTQNGQLGVIGANHFIPVGEQSYLKSTVAYSFNNSELVENRPYQSELLKEFYNAKLKNQTTRLATTLHHKFNSKHRIQVGVLYSISDFDFKDKYFNISQNEYLNGQTNDGAANFSQGFISWQWRVTELLTAVNGVHVSKSDLNSKVFIEPRMALKYQLNETQILTAGLGMHSKMASLPNHYANVYQLDGNFSTPNKNLELMQAAHYVVGYENSLKKNLFLKVEAYYQHLYNIPIENKVGSQYSLINQNDFFVDKALLNDGEGQNIGLEITLERNFSNQFYYLFTTSLYDSKYKAKSGGWKVSRYNGNFAGNFLLGKEFSVGKDKQKDKTIGINSRVTLLGGRRYTPIDLAASIQQGEEVEIGGELFSKKAPDVLYLNLAVSYRVNKAKVSHEVKLDIQNIANSETPIDYFYNKATMEIEEISQLSLLPIIKYTINF
jgi:hypothetical protein